MPKTFSGKIYLTLGIFIVCEILSFIGFFNPVISQLTFIALVVLTLALSLIDLEYGFLVVLGELFIGSLGHLFDFPFGAGAALPIRIALWSTVMIVFGVRFLTQIFRQRTQAPYWLSLKNFHGRKIIGWLFLFIALGLLSGFLFRHNLKTILADFNAWLYFLTILPAIIIYHQGDSGSRDRLAAVFWAGAIWLSLKTLILVFVFSHNYAVSGAVYHWLRDTLVGEMTPTATGWPRVFIQGQIFAAIAFFILFWKWVKEKTESFFSRRAWPYFSLGALFFSAILLSFSRSFWAGWLGAALLSLIIIGKRDNLKKAGLALAWLVSAVILSFVLIYLIMAFPYWHFRTTDFGDSFLARASSGQDAAVASRWSLLPALLKADLKEPLLGQGFGATVTYISSDPRVLANNPSGRYTTYAFEWGYLGLWLKLGLLGLIAYLVFLWRLVADGLKTAFQTEQYLFYALPAGVIFLVITNIFTPYLNHPLGIGFLVLSSCLIWPNKVY